MTMRVLVVEDEIVEVVNGLWSSLPAVLQSPVFNCSRKGILLSFVSLVVRVVSRDSGEWLRLLR
jgi:hypothetical protein